MSSAPGTSSATPPGGTGHEPEGSSVRGIGYGAIIFLASLAIILVVVGGILRSFRRAEPLRVHSNTPAQLTTSPVGAWIDPVGDLARLRRREDEHLATYGWLDREKGIAHIPIAVAMQRLIERAGSGAATQPAQEVRENP